MGTGPSRLFLERVHGQRAVERHHERVVRGGCAVCPDASCQQPHRSLHAGDRPRGIYHPPARNLRVDKPNWSETPTAPQAEAVVLLTKLTLYKNLQKSTKKFFAHAHSIHELGA